MFPLPNGSLSSISEFEFDLHFYGYHYSVLYLAYVRTGPPGFIYVNVMHTIQGQGSSVHGLPKWLHRRHLCRGKVKAWTGIFSTAAHNLILSANKLIHETTRLDLYVPCLRSLPSRLVRVRFEFDDVGRIDLVLSNSQVTHPVKL